MSRRVLATFLTMVMITIIASVARAQYTGPELKIPLRSAGGGVYVTVEAGGLVALDVCRQRNGDPCEDPYHRNNSYFSIDFDDDRLTGDVALAAAAGTVSTNCGSVGYGNCVKLDHGNGYTTYYGHLSTFNVENGQRVVQGQELGVIGNTGNSDGPHLHFELRYNGQGNDGNPHLEGVKLDGDTLFEDYTAGQRYPSTNTDLRYPFQFNPNNGDGSKLCASPPTGGAATNWVYTCTGRTAFTQGETVYTLFGVREVFQDVRFKHLLYKRNEQDNWRLYPNDPEGVQEEPYPVSHWIGPINLTVGWRHIYNWPELTNLPVGEYKIQFCAKVGDTYRCPRQAITDFSVRVAPISYSDPTISLAAASEVTTSACTPSTPCSQGGHCTDNDDCIYGLVCSSLNTCLTPADAAAIAALGTAGISDLPPPWSGQPPPVAPSLTWKVEMEGATPRMGALAGYPRPDTRTTRWNEAYQCLMFSGGDSGSGATLTLPINNIITTTPGTYNLRIRYLNFHDSPPFSVATGPTTFNVPSGGEHATSGDLDERDLGAVTFSSPYPSLSITIGGASVGQGNRWICVDYILGTRIGDNQDTNLTLASTNNNPQPIQLELESSTTHPNQLPGFPQVQYRTTRTGEALQCMLFSGGDAGSNVTLTLPTNTTPGTYTLSMRYLNFVDSPPATLTLGSSTILLPAGNTRAIGDDPEEHTLGTITIPPSQTPLTLTVTIGGMTTGQGNKWIGIDWIKLTPTP